MPSSRADDPTDENVAFPWRTGLAPTALPALHVVIAWFLNEPERTGQAARIDGPCWLGRGSGEGEPVPAAEFRLQRPGESTVAPPLIGTALSRKQLVFVPIDGESVGVRCVGRRTLFHNGAECAECVVRAGDTLMLDLTAVFVVEARPSEFAGSLRYPKPEFGFGLPDPDGLVGETPAAWVLRDQLAVAAAADDHVLVVGESGAGKELAAAVIHRLSARRGGPFVARNAATLPAGLVDAELFGTARNYPNVGSPERDGLIAAADGGTLLLDEIGELSEEHQAHLLRVLDRGAEYHRLGESRARRSDFRLVAATNRDPGALKHDFLARFSVTIAVPPLGDRRSDIPFIAQHLLRRVASESADVRERFFDGGIARLEPALVEALVRHPYRHHTRELFRLLRVAIGTSLGTYLALTPAVQEALRGDRTPSVPPPEVSATVPELPAEVARVGAVLRGEKGNVSRAAEKLGMSRFALHRFMRKHGLGEE